jgi:hypothetical protein
LAGVGGEGSVAGVAVAACLSPPLARLDLGYQPSLNLGVIDTGDPRGRTGNQQIAQVGVEHRDRHPRQTQKSSKRAHYLRAGRTLDSLPRHLVSIVTRHE